MNIFTYYKGYKDPHKGLKVYSEISREIPSLKVLKVPMHVPFKIKKRIDNKLLAIFFKFFGHFFLIFRIFKYKGNKLIIREFLTIPLILLFPLFWFFRKRLYFLCQHNLALANKKYFHKLSLKLLQYFGFKFIIYDNVNLWNVVSKQSNNIFCLYLPVIENNKMIVKNTKLTIGFVGNFRKEKSPYWAINKVFDLQKISLNKFEILLGTSDEEFFSKFQNENFIKIITKSYSEYLRALSLCDLIILPYDKDSYMYRTSGVLAEAVAFNTKVFLPNIVGLYDQLTIPTPIGATYNNEEDFNDSLIKMIEKLESGYFEKHLDTYRNFRSKSNIKNLMIKEFIND